MRKEILILTLLALPSLQQMINKNESIVMLIEMITPGDKIPLITDHYPLQEFNDYLSISEVGKRKQLLLGKHVRNQYPLILNNLPRSMIQAESLASNWTIKSINSHIVGLYNIFDGGKLGFEANASQVLPPEKLSFDPSKVIDFDTALPHGIRFIPVYSSSGEHSLKFSVSHEFCGDLKSISLKAIASSNARLGRNEYFKKKLEQVEGELRLRPKGGDTGNYLERGVSALYIYNKRVDEGKGDILTEEDVQFLIGCESSYLLSIYEDLWTSKIQAGLTNSHILEKILDRIFHLETEENFQNILDEIDIDFGVKATEDIKKKRTKDKTENIKMHLMSVETTQMLSELVVRGLYNNAKNCHIKRTKSLHKNDCQEVPPAASNLIYELHKSPQGYKIRILYNSEPIQCSVNADKEYCSLKEFSSYLHKISEKDLKFKCADHLPHKYPEVEQKGLRTYVHVLISGSLILTSIIFLAVGLLFRSKLNRMESLIERELGKQQKKEK